MAERLNRLRAIQKNCSKATFLIEKRQFGQLTLGERVELRIHLAGCSLCRMFQRQSIVINEMVRGVFLSPNVNDIVLDEEFKNQLQNRIDRETER